MTNIIGIGILIIATNWGNPIIPKSTWKMIHAFKGVPAVRGRVGVVVEKKVVKFDWDGKKRQVIVSEKIISHVQQLGKVTDEKIAWTRVSPLILKGNAKKAVKKPLDTNPVAKRKWYRLWQKR